jgi:hypothetical protein
MAQRTGGVGVFEGRMPFCQAKSNSKTTTQGCDEEQQQNHNTRLR